MTSQNDGLVGYNVYGVCTAEVELDVLTGNHVIRRLDLLEDTGVSMSPEIDVGQVGWLSFILISSYNLSKPLLTCNYNTFLYCCRLKKKYRL